MATQTREQVLLGVGDIMVVHPRPKEVFRRVSSVFRAADFVVGNVEVPICDRGEPVPDKAMRTDGPPILRSILGTEKALKETGFAAVGLANNHQWDYQADGLLQTIELLDGAGVAHAGSGKNLEEAHRPAYVERGGTRVALLSYTTVIVPVGAARQNKPGVAHIKIDTLYQPHPDIFQYPGRNPIIITRPDAEDVTRMVEGIARAKQEADVVVVSFHGGHTGGLHRACGYMKELGHSAIDAGADLFLGHHPHELHGVEMYRGKLICYSVGHFAFGFAAGGALGHDSVIVKCRIRDRRITQYSLLPVEIMEEPVPGEPAAVLRFELNRRLRPMSLEPRPLEPQEIGKWLEMMESRSQEFGTTLTLQGNEVVVGGPRPGTPEPLRGAAVLVDRWAP